MIKNEDYQPFESPFQKSLIKSLDQNHMMQLESPKIDANLIYLRGKEPESDLESASSKMLKES